MELSGEGANTYNKDGVPIIKNPMPQGMIDKFKQLDTELDVKLLSEMAISMKDHTRVDGTSRFGASNSIEVQLYKKIISKDNSQSNRPHKNIHDALITEAAVHYGCILVSDDGPLRKSVNKILHGGIITTDELLEKINSY